MKKLFTGLSFIAIAVFVACDGSGTNANNEPLENSSNSSSESFDEYDGEVEFFDDLPRCTGKKDGKVYYVEDEDIAYTCRYDEDEEAGEWVRKKKKSSDDDDKESSSSARKPDVSSSSLESNGDYDGSSSSDEADEGKSSASEEPESSGSEGVEGSSASVSGEMVSCDIPGVMGECMEYPVGSDEAAQLTEFCVSMLGGTLGAGCTASTSDSSVYDAMANTLTDLRDGQVYKTTTIEVPSKNYSEVWMAENLNYRYLGPTLTEDSSSFCYGDESVNCTKYGRLYLWSATMDSAGIIKGNTANGCGYGSKCAPSGTVRGVCPQGWHLPSYDEWEALIVAVDGSITEYTSSNTAGSKLKSVTGWSDSGNGTDTFGFSALPVGYRNYNGNYYSEGYGAPFWSSTGNNSNDAYDMGVYYDFGDAYLDYGDNKNFGLSVRCLKD